jgi:hypothetical protein
MIEIGWIISLILGKGIHMEIGWLIYVVLRRGINLVISMALGKGWAILGIFFLHELESSMVGCMVGYVRLV